MRPPVDASGSTSVGSMSVTPGLRGARGVRPRRVDLVLTGSLDGLFGTGTARGAGARALSGYGPLIDDPAGLLSLPEGFSYKVVAHAGVTTLETGQPTPGDPDGTASFVRR